MNKQELASIMVKYGDTQAKLAKDMGLSLSRLNAKINQYHGADFTQTEIAFIAKRYQLASSDIHSIFFTSFVSQKDTTNAPRYES